MGERVNDSVSVPASLQDVLDVILDLEAYPQWAEGVKQVDVLERDDQGRPLLARFVIDIRVAQIDYTLRYDHTGPHLRWQLETGDVLRQLDGEYQLVEDHGVTDVHYTLEVDVTLPFPGFLKNRAARTILDTSLRGLHDRVVSRADS